MFASRHDAASSFSNAVAASLCALALLALSPTGARAVEATASDRAACTSDVFRLCASSVPNVNRIIACLDRQRPQLSPACRAVFAAKMPARTATRSLVAATPEWCAFQRGDQRPTEEMWQTWCKGRDQ